jgi:predicted nucleic acid-binding protein
MVLDADVVIRYLTNDDKEKADRFERFLNSGKQVVLLDVTIAEVYWTLSSYYKFGKPKVIKTLDALINHSATECNLAVWQMVWEFLRTNNKTSLIDGYCAVRSLVDGDGKIMSFDKGFDSLAGINRIEP